VTDALAIAEGLLRQPTAPFVEDLPAAHVRSFADERGLPHETDAAGNVVVKYGGPGVQGGAPRSEGTPLVLMAHLDHPGFLTRAGDVGVIDMDFKGGLSAAHALAESPVEFFRRGVIDPVGRGRVVDVTADGRGYLDRATAGVVDGEVGDFAMWAFPGWSIEDGRVTGRVCDDLLGAAAILAVLDELATSRPSTCVWGLFTRAEEEGFLGAFEAIRLGTVPKDADVLSLECSKALPHAPQGGGVIVRVGDRMSIFDPSLTAALEAAAGKVEGLTFQRRLMDGGACEATAFCAAGYRSSGVAVPLGGYHNASDDGHGIVPETVMVSDYLAEVQLLTSLAHSPDLLRPSGPPAWFAERSEKARQALA
jgi:putative aminopeptidase FrvX